MPFPLAHPAVAVPFRRWCPKYLDFSALVVGCIVPDLAASIGDLEYFSHSILGSFAFCLPVGLMTVWILRQIQAPLVSTLPNPHRSALLPLCCKAPYSLLRVSGSVMLGTWFHIGWDMFTHERSWLVRHSLLSSVRIGGMPLNRFVWLISSIVGIFILAQQYLLLLRKTTARTPSPAGSDGRAYAFWIGMLLLPFVGAVPLALHDPTYYHGALLSFIAMYYLSCSYLTFAIAGFVLSYQQKRHGGSVRVGGGADRLSDSLSK